MWFGGCYFDGSHWSGPFDTRGNIAALSGPVGEGPIGVGSDGVIANLTSTAATAYPSPVKGKVLDVQATGSSDVWLSGHDDTGSMWQPVLSHWDGNGFTSYTHASSTAGSFGAVAAVPGGTPWVNDDFNHETSHFANGAFTSPPDSPATHLYAMWAAASDAIWAVTGEDPTIYFYDGTAWQTASHILSTSDVQLKAVWGRSKNDVWVAGSSGMTEHWDGSKWSAASSPASMVSIIGGFADYPKVWAATEGGTILSWDGSQWYTSLTLEKSPLSALHGCSKNEIWAANGTRGAPLLHRFDGRDWLDSNPGIASSLYHPHLWCASPGDVWLVFGSSAILRRQTP
jgi:hypothetical protein